LNFEHLPNKSPADALTLSIGTDADLIDLKPATCAAERVLCPLVQ